jgi:HAD superfamily hydrolase (TIGR01509 family)
MARDGIQVLMFDLGGVLVDFAGPRELGQYLRTPATPRDILDRWIDCPHTKEFERGRISSQEWATRFIAAWGVDLEPAEFLTEFRSWSRCILPGAKELLDSLRSRYRLAALSNSNEIHWERNTNELGIIQLFDVALSSHQLGLCKPDPEIFRAALTRLDTPASAVMFFDDMAVNVDVAASIGIYAHQVSGVVETRACLA